ncbi:MAG: HD domain-containing protein [Tepidisphaeraceae bacterium]|jgi:3'-5' exoribonuclease
MRRLYLANAAAGDLLDDVFVFTGKQLAATSTGKFYLKGFLSDRTAQMTVRMWNATREEFDALPESGFLKVRGRVENYQNNLQFILEGFDPPKEGTFEAAELIPTTDKDIPQMTARLLELLASIHNKHLAGLMRAYTEDKRLMERFCRAPAAMTFHHAFIGGLLEHTLNSMEVADAVCKFYPGLNRDLVVAGIFLHDIAKTWELSYDCAFGYTDGGQLVGHIVKSAVWVEHKRRTAEQALGEPIPQPIIDVMQHIIISHHGVPEFGAIKPPGTPEAIAVHFIENLDAKLMMSLQSCRGQIQQGSEGNFTEYMKAFGGRLYRPDPAPMAEPPAAPAKAVGPAEKAGGKPVLNNPMFETAKPKK